MILRVTTGELIKAWREKAGLTQEQLGELADKGRSYVADCEGNRASPTVRILLQFIAAIERAWAPFPKDEHERLARFFLGPGREGTLIVAKETIPLGGPRR